MSRLEQLPDELFLDLFDYLNGDDILHAFHGLNSRFESLLYNKYRHYNLQLNSTSKRHFDLVCHQHLPLIVDRIRTLHLSNDEDTPEQIDLFLSHFPSFNLFTHLHLLSLAHVSSYPLISTILQQCHHLSSLLSLKLDSCSLEIDQADFQSMMNKVWRLPKLIYFLFDVISTDQPYLFTLTTISSTLKHVIIYRKSFEANEFDNLRQYTPHLKYLSILMSPSLQKYSLQSSFPTLIHLNLRLYERSEDLIPQILQNTPNLHHLEIILLNNLIDGHQWEQIIRQYLSTLKTFRLKMKGTLSHNRYLREHLDRLFHSFQSPFWIVQRQWFIRCLTWGPTVHLYTLPNKSSYYEQTLPNSQRSTKPDDTEQDFYQSLTNIYDDKFFDQILPTSIRLPKIRSLHIKLPINRQFWSVVPSLEYLTSLTIVSHRDVFQSQVQVLLDRALHLESLTINQDVDIPLQTALFNYTNISVRDLDLQNLNYCFNEDECIRLSRSPLGTQCQKLTIVVRNRESIVTLVQRMNHLRMLKVQLNDEVIHWLKDHLSPTYLITRNIDHPGQILIWI